MSSIANPIASTSIIPSTKAATPASTSTGTSAVGDPLANESTFLTLLVSQLQNQDPLSPTDSNQFVSQLTSYSQLEQLIGIHSNTTALAGASTVPTANPTTSAAPTTPVTPTTPTTSTTTTTTPTN